MPEDRPDHHLVEMAWAADGCMDAAMSVDGCMDAAMSADPSDPRRINVLEVWASAEALDRWREVADAPDIDVESDDAAVKRYDATDGGPMF